MDAQRRFLQSPNIPARQTDLRGEMNKSVWRGQISATAMSSFQARKTRLPGHSRSNENDRPDRASVPSASEVRCLLRGQLWWDCRMDPRPAEKMFCDTNEELTAVKEWMIKRTRAQTVWILWRDQAKLHLQKCWTHNSMITWNAFNWKWQKTDLITIWWWNSKLCSNSNNQFEIVVF